MNSEAEGVLMKELVASSSLDFQFIGFHDPEKNKKFIDIFGKLILNKYYYYFLKIFLKKKIIFFRQTGIEILGSKSARQS